MLEEAISELGVKAVNAAKTVTKLLTDDEPVLSGSQMVERRIADTVNKQKLEKLVDRAAKQMDQVRIAETVKVDVNQTVDNALSLKGLSPVVKPASKQGA